MATDPRAALDRLVAAFEAHLETALTVRDPDAESVQDAALALGEAFDIYDEALYTGTGVDTPFVNVEDGDDDDDDDFDEFDDDDDDDDDDDLLEADDDLGEVTPE